MNVPERITGIERDVWDCFSDTSNVDDDLEQDDEETDEGIGCAGWDREHVTKWPVGEAIKLWSYGDAHYLKIFDEVLQDVGAFLNLEIERVATGGTRRNLRFIPAWREKTQIRPVWTA